MRDNILECKPVAAFNYCSSTAHLCCDILKQTWFYSKMKELFLHI